MIKHYEVVNEANLVNKAIEPEAIYYCIDSGNVYIDSIVLKKRINIGNGLIVLDTEDERTTITSPMSNKFYFVKSSNKLYIYTNDWVDFETILLQSLYSKLEWKVIQ